MNYSFLFIESYFLYSNTTFQTAETIVIWTFAVTFLSLVIVFL